MDQIAVLAVQLIVVLCIAVSLLLWLVGIRRPALDPNRRPVLITGTQGPLIRACAERLLARGCRVFVGVTPGLPVASIPTGVHLMDLDVTNDVSVEGAVQTVLQNLPQGEEGLWAVVNIQDTCAGGLLEWLSWKEGCELPVKQNLLGTVRLLRAFLPLLRRAHGRVVVVSRRGGPGWTIQATIEGALRSMLQCLREELRRFGLHFAMIECGLVGPNTTGAMPRTEVLDRMWTNMSLENRKVYGPTFRSFCSNMTSEGAATIDVEATEQGILNDLENALFQTDPRELYQTSTNTGVLHNLSPWAEPNEKTVFESTFLKTQRKKVLKY